MDKNLEFALEHSRNYGPGHFPEVFPLDFGMDFHLETKPELYPEINYSYNRKNPENKERTVKLEISTFRGVCWEAMHWYGKLRADGINIIEEHIDTDGKTHKMSVGGYICDEYKNMKNKEHYDSYYDFEITRPITKEDVEKYPDRFEADFIGYATNAFYSIDEIIKIAKKVAAARFPDWKFVIEK